MKSTVENLSPTRVRLAVEVPFDVIQPSLDNAYKTLAQQIRVPGFRPGKVPARVIDQRVGRENVLQEALNEVLPRLYTEAAREHELNPLGQPDVDITELNDGESISFTAEVDIRPEITLPELHGIAVSVDDAEVTDADVDEQVEELRKRFGTLKAVERVTEDGDYVSLDITTTIDGAEVEGGSSTGRSYVIGSDSYIDGLDAAVTGKAAGDTVSFTAPLRAGEHADTDAEITVLVKSVKVQELPEIDEDFAQLASEFDTVEELKDDLRTRLARVRVMEQGAQARDHVLEHLIDTIDFPLPESALKAEIEQREHEIVHQLGHDDAQFQAYLDFQGQTREEFDAAMAESAEKSVRAQFILDAVADKSDVQIGDAELTEYLVRQAQQYQMPPQEFANEIVQGGRLPLLVADIRRNKALAEVLENAAVTDASGNTVDLAALSGSGAQDVDDMDADDLDDDEDDAEGVEGDPSQD
ncbi:MAG: trigger factor [Jatrophihabitans sp.]